MTTAIMLKSMQDTTATDRGDVLEGDSKWYARIQALNAINEAR